MRLQSRERGGSTAGPPPRAPQPGGPIALAILYMMLALTAVLIAISFWRKSPGFLRHSFATNTAIMTAGLVLVGYQLAGYFRG